MKANTKCSYLATAHCRESDGVALQNWRRGGSVGGDVRSITAWRDDIGRGRCCRREDEEVALATRTNRPLTVGDGNGGKQC